MVTTRRILCPTDFSPFAESALEQAIVLGRRYEAEIVSLHVIPTLVSSVRVEPPPQLDAEARQRVLAELERFTEPARAAGLMTRLELREAGVTSSILELARSLPADLVVMGTHGASGFERLMLGSVTEKVLRRATCPVLTVPRRAHEAGHTPHAGFKSIACPVDFAASSERALHLAVSLARENSARLLLIHVLEGMADGGVLDLTHWTVPEYRAILEKEARERLSALVGPEDRSACAIEEVLAAGKPYVEILRLAEKRACDLIVMGTHGGAVETALFGSTAQHVVRGAACPVVTVRP
jgi:nucleotide-binding universal stress UspA family protein